MEFGKKHLPDKFFLEGIFNKSLRNTIIREMVSNTLMHREFSSSYAAKFVIEKDRMYVDNASRASCQGYITVDNPEPNPKNPIIAFSETSDMRISWVPACGICSNTTDIIQAGNLISGRRCFPDYCPYG